ncbi:phenylalanine--tRNA ligase beta subunit-related protein [Paraclostridium bifermentans]|uniref:Phenylalanine--tRNA ligase beta subunit-related protein n=1 Tax=Paraclostridium bifermentans TaxID=1490 RepID=A0ABY8R7A3_PARBF|nr:phenylalanine--tRNA ligase beta subunit-related protein [Paraclostridium bifermentans]
MKFSVSSEVFEKLDNVCFGVIVAKGIDNNLVKNNIVEKLNQSIKDCEDKFKDTKVKELEGILCYRDAFKELGINPNKFMSSIEAMLTRTSKGKGLPNISPIVDLGNAVSLKYMVPLGAHDIDTLDGDIEVRFSKEGDSFIPLGTEETEVLEDGELIYSAGDNVRTRRWIWRQSEQGKITNESKNIFFPIDGFENKNYESVISARDELASLLKEVFSCDVKVGFIDKNNTEFEI